MKNKLISTILAIVMVLSVLVTLTGCNEGDFPVKVANITIDSEPKNIVILDPTTADIVSYMNYDVKLVGRSTEVNQEWLSVASDVGSMYNPNIDKIAQLDTNLVFASKDMPISGKKKLEEMGITVITMALAETPAQLEKNYETIGKILGGKTTGGNKGKMAYSELIEEMEAVKSTVDDYRTSSVYDTVCYLYSKNSQLQLMTSGTFGDMLLNYTGAVNMAINIVEKYPDANVIKIANPDFIFYDSEETFSAIKNDKVLGQLSAIKNKKTLMVTNEEMNLQGESALITLSKMVSFMYPELGENNSEETTSENEKTTKPEDTTKDNEKATEKATDKTTEKSTEDSKQTSDATEPTTENTSVADDYKIKLDGLSLKIEDENDNVKAMQKRLYDLGYVDDKENITGYYGTISEAAVKAFQKKNGIKETGKADNDTLIKMFDSNAVKAK